MTNTNNADLHQFFEEMYDKTYKLVYYIINRIVNNREVTEDLVQETFLSAFNNVDKLEAWDENSFKPWVSVIASNKAKDYVKKKKPYLFTDMGTNDYEYEPEDDRVELRPDILADKQEVSKLVNRIMEELPEDQRLIVMMFYFQQLSIKEIAQETNLNENTIKSKLKYAKDKIKTMIENAQSKGFKLFGLSPMALFVHGLFDVGSSTVSVIPPIPMKSNNRKSKNNRINSSNVLTIVGTTALLTGTIITGAQVLNPINSDTKKPSPPVVEEVKTDLFNYLDIRFEGVDGNGEAVITKKSSEDSDLNIIIQSMEVICDDKPLSNNTLLYIKLKPTQSSKYQFDPLEKLYIVKGLES